MRSVLRVTAAGLGLLWAAEHLLLAPEHLKEQAYVGVLFVVGGLMMAVAAWRIIADDVRWGWGLGGLTAAGGLALLVCSRTVGLPGGYLEGWEPAAVGSLLLAAGFLAVVLARVVQAVSALEEV